MSESWRGLEVLENGGGRVELRDGGVRLSRPATNATSYANAQVGDPGSELRRRPPLVLRFRARFSHSAASLRGTAGFGFWNAALSPAQVHPRLPRAAWFFFSAPPHDVPLALGVPGNGPKAAVLDADRPPFFALAPFALPGFAAMRSPSLHRRLWPFAQWAIGVQEAALSALDLTAWHDYSLDWRANRAVFRVDGATVLSTSRSPRGPLTMVAWLDNAFAVATPQGRFAMGTVGTADEQWLELDDISIEEGRTRLGRGLL